jgi:hypothetical protein
MLPICRYRSVILSAGTSLALFFVAAPVLQAQIRDGGIDAKNLGKGDWVFSITDATNKLGGHVSSVTNENSLMLFYKSQGIRYMIVKAGTGATLFNGCYGFPQFTVNLCNVAHANGILIFGYNRSYATNTAGEVAIADFVFNQGADGFVWDAEAEWESGAIGSQGPALAWNQCSTVRSNWPNKFLAHSPFAIIYVHSSFPYKEFGYWCDAVMPQIYHFSTAGLQKSPSAAINWTDVNWKTWQASLVGSSSVINGQTIFWTNSIKPVVPIQDVYGPIISGGVICEGTASAQPDEDVLEFIDYLSADPNTPTTGGYRGANFFRTDLHGSVQWANIKSGTLGSFTGIVNNVVLDDSKASIVGAWTAVKVFGATTTSPTYYGATGSDTNSFGTNYFTSAHGTGSGYMQFAPTITAPGDYNIYQWHPYVTNASAGVPHVISYNGGSTTIFANQQTNSGNWSLLGKFNFASGTGGTIRVTDATTEPSGTVAIVDGLKLLFVPPTSVPATPTGLVATAISSSQINLTWNDNATNENNYLLSRSTVSGGPYTQIATLPANATNYNNTGLVADTTYYYVVRATNFLGASAYSGEASATTLSGAPTPPSILSQPQSTTNIAGQNATFTVSASGTLPLSYQWRFNGSDIPGATDGAYTRTNIQTNDAGAYSVAITNSAGSTSSAPATLTVNFSLLVTPSAGGSVSKNPDQSSYVPNSSVILTAIPDAGFAFVGWSGDVTASINPLTVLMDTNKSITASFISTATDIILDNTNPAVTFYGAWQTGTSSVDKFGPDYRFASTVAGGLSNAVYCPAIYAPGYYDVLIWYPQGSNRATNAPWSVVYFGGGTNVAVDQTISGGGWRLIAPARPFQQGTNGYVTLSNDTGYSGKVVLADAVRFTLVGPFPSPPLINSITQLSDGRIQLEITGSPAHYAIEATTDFSDWIELTNFTTATSNFEYTDPQTIAASRYYRIRLIP